MTILIKSAALGLAAVVLVAPAAHASQSQNSGGCAVPFTAYTLPELIELGNTFGFPPADTEALFAYYNRNNDGLICLQPHPKQGPDAFNFVDNNAHVGGQ